MIAQHLIQEWAKDGFKHPNKAEWLRSAAASVGASMLIAQIRNPLKIRPWKAAAAVALLGAAAVPWDRLVKRKTTPEGTPSYRDDGCRNCQQPLDALEEADMESFPASDPPARGHV